VLQTGLLATAGCAAASTGLHGAVDAACARAARHIGGVLTAGDLIQLRQLHHACWVIGCIGEFRFPTMNYVFYAHRLLLSPIRSSSPLRRAAERFFSALRQRATSMCLLVMRSFFVSANPFSFALKIPQCPRTSCDLPSTLSFERCILQAAGFH